MMAMAATLVDNCVDTFNVSGWVLFPRGKVALSDTELGGGWSRGFLSQPHMQLVSWFGKKKKKKKNFTGRGEASHHTPLLSSTKQKGNVKACEMNTNSRYNQRNTSSITTLKKRKHIQLHTRQPCSWSWTSATVAFKTNSDNHSIWLMDGSVSTTDDWYSP